MIAVDTNLLVYAHRRDSEFHAMAAAQIRQLAEGQAAWAIPWPCAHEFLAIATHPRIFDPPSTRDQAIAQIEAWAASPSLSFLGEGPGYWAVLKALVTTGRVVGPLVHDARVAALCIAHGAHELWSADRDFSRFPAIRIRNPLIPQ